MCGQSAQPKSLAQIADAFHIDHGAISAANSWYVESGCCNDSTGIGVAIT
jgi:hypothetical protein